MITEDEIGMELVLLLDPDTLEQSGGTYGCPPAFRVQGEHFFLCIEADDANGRWVPLYSKPGKDRVAISTQGRTGHPKWVEGTVYYHPAQVWFAPHQAVVAAAVGDWSKTNSRNTLHEDYFPRL